MAEKATIARPYARAAFAYASAAGELAAWSDVLATLAVVTGDARVRAQLSNPALGAAKAVDLLANVTGQGVTSAVRNFLGILASNRRLALLPDISDAFAQLRADAENTADVQVVSAVALESAQAKRLQDALQQRLRRTVRLACSVDGALLGGAVIRYGDMVIDGSLKTRLQRLTSAISN